MTEQKLIVCIYLIVLSVDFACNVDTSEVAKYPNEVKTSSDTTTTTFNFVKYLFWEKV